MVEERARRLGESSGFNLGVKYPLPSIPVVWTGPLKQVIGLESLRFRVVEPGLLTTKVGGPLSLADLASVLTAWTLSRVSFLVLGKELRRGD